MPSVAPRAPASLSLLLLGVCAAGSHGPSIIAFAIYESAGVVRVSSCSVWHCITLPSSGEYWSTGRGASWPGHRVGAHAAQLNAVRPLSLCTVVSSIRSPHSHWVNSQASVCSGDWGSQAVSWTSVFAQLVPVCFSLSFSTLWQNIAQSLHFYWATKCSVNTDNGCIKVEAMFMTTDTNGKKYTAISI